MEIQGSVNYQEVIGTVNDPRRVTAEVIAAVRGEKGDQGDPAPGYVEMNDTNTEIMGNYKIQFDQNEFYSDCYLNDGTGDVTLILDPDFEHISGVEKTFLIAGTGVELNLGLGFHLLSGVFDTREREINIVHLLYSAVSGVWVTIKNNNVAEKGIVYGDVTFTPTVRILSEEVRAAIEEVDAKFIDQEFETVPLITNEIDLGSATSDKIEVTISDTDTLESLGTSTEGVRKIVRILLTGDSSDTLTVTHDIRAILLPEQGELVFRHGNNRELWFEAICRGERLWHFVKINSSYSMFTAPDDIADLEDAVNLATANAGEIPFVKVVEGVKSFDYSSGFKFVNGVLQLNDSNIGIGVDVFKSRVDGSSNIGIGNNALTSMTETYGCLALGYESLSQVLTGEGDTAIGSESLPLVTASNYNTAVGYQSAKYWGTSEGSLTNPVNSVFLGAKTKSKAAEQTNEIVIGYDAIGNGSNSVTLGNDSITQTILKGNIGIGYTGFANTISYPLQIKTTTAHESAALGNELLSSSNWTSTGWTGDFATGFTHTAGNTTALSNTLAAVTNNLYQITYTVTGRTAGTFTIAFGGQSNAGLSATGAWCPKASSTAALTITPTTDFNGTIVISIKQITGVSTPTQVFVDSAGNVSMAIRNSLSTLYNTFVGNLAGVFNTTGYQNTAIGGYSLYSNTTGYRNSAMGSYSLYSNITGNQNSAMGYYSLYYNTTGLYNSAMGYASLISNTTGSLNSAMGYYSLYSNTTGYWNTAIGGYSLYYNTTGLYNSAMGYNSGRYLSDGSTARATGDYGIYIGVDTKASTNGTTNEIVIGYQAIGNGSNTATFGNSSITNNYFSGNVRATGSIKVANDTATADATKVGSLRYRTSGNNSYCDMCMQTGASTYAWITIIQQNW